MTSEAILLARIAICVKKLDTFAPRKIREVPPKRARLTDRLGNRDLIH